MTAAAVKSVQCITPGGLHRLSYREWGDAANPRVLICVHGLTRSARDFDVIAAALCRHYRVICPDMPGRGESDWLRNPMEYALPFYVADMVTLIARLDVPTVHWLGTSMGGLIGMALAALPQTPISRLVLNEAGALVSGVSLRRIASYLGQWPAMPDLAAAEDYVRRVCAPFGPHSDAQWRALTEAVVKPLDPHRPEGGWRMHYDPAIALPFQAGAGLVAAGSAENRAGQAEPMLPDVDLWPLWDAVRCPTLLLRGAESDLLSADTARAMTRCGPQAPPLQLKELPGIGHAPSLLQPEQVALVREFLLRDGG
jgi:pimeloyl-ACP methyl ester carboxylesterase